MKDAIKDKPDSILEQPYEKQRKLIDSGFTGRDEHENRLGVYVAEADQGWTFEIKGVFGNAILTLPLSDEYLIEAFHLNPEIHDIEIELKDIKGSMQST